MSFHYIGDWGPRITIPWALFFISAVPTSEACDGCGLSHPSAAAASDTAQVTLARLLPLFFSNQLDVLAVVEPVQAHSKLPLLGSGVSLLLFTI